MKKVIFVSVLLLHSLVIFSQSENVDNKKRMKYGFNIGLNHSNLIDNNTLSTNASISNNMGFRLGILADYRISKILFLSPKAELSFNNSKVEFSSSVGSQTEYQVMPVSLDLMAHLVFKKDNEKLSPYFLVGPNVKIPVSKKNYNSSTFSTNSDFAIDFGFGVDNALSYFNFSPELRSSFGLFNINQHPSIQSLNFHNISLVFNFT